MAAIELKTDAVTPLANELYFALNRAESDRTSYIQRVKDYRDLIKAEQPRDEKPWEGACELHIPLLRYFRNAFLARTNRGLLGTTPLFYVDGLGDLSEQYDGNVEKYLEYLSRFALQLPRAYRAALQLSFDDGTAGVYTTWEQRFRYERQIGSVLDYDFPRVNILPIDMFGVFPAAEQDVQNAQGMYIKLNLTGNDLLLGVNDGSYDVAQVKSLREQRGTDTEYREREETTDRGVQISASSEITGSFHSKTFDCAEWYWRYAEDDTTIATDWLITMEVPTRTILRAIPNPWAHGRRPMAVSHILPMKFGIMGESFGDLAGDTQRFMTTIMRYMCDSVEIRTNPELAVSSAISDAQIEKWKRTRKPGGIQRFTTENIQQALQTIQLGIDPNLVLPFLATIMQFGERSVGFSNTMIGAQPGRETTATEITKMLEEGQEQILDITDNLSYALSDVGAFLLALSREYAGNESIEALWRLSNPELPEEATAALVLDGAYHVQASGTNVSTNRSLRRQNAKEVFAVMRDDEWVNANPLRAWELRQRLLVEGFDDHDSTKLIGTEQEAQQVQQLMQMQAQTEQEMTPGEEVMPVEGAPDGG